MRYPKTDCPERSALPPPHRRREAPTRSPGHSQTTHRHSRRQPHYRGQDRTRCNYGFRQEAPARDGKWDLLRSSHRMYTPLEDTDSLFVRKAILIKNKTIVDKLGRHGRRSPSSSIMKLTIGSMSSIGKVGNGSRSSCGRSDAIATTPGNSVEIGSRDVAPSRRISIFG